MNILKKNNRITYVATALILLMYFGACEKTVNTKLFPPVQACPGTPEVVYYNEVYPTVLIGEQCWLAKNLNIGKQIPHVQISTNNDTIEKYCYQNSKSNCDYFGGLYKWDELMQYSDIEGGQGICPEGWRIPTTDDFMELYFFVEGCPVYLLKGDSIQASEINELEGSTNGWNGKTGFDLLMGGTIIGSPNLPFTTYPNWTKLWTSSSSTAIFHYDDFYIHKLQKPNPRALYVRCLKNQE